MKYLRPMLFLVLFFCTNTNETFSQTSAFSHEKYINETGDTLNYRMLYPDWNTFRKYPLIIFLHGS